MCVGRRMIGARVYSVVHWRLGCGLVGLLVVVLVATHTYMVEVVNDILSGDIPHCHLLLASRLIAQEKPQGGVRPIAIGEVFLCLSSICDLSTAQSAADLLLPPQYRRGYLRGCRDSRALTEADFCNAADVVTVQVTCRAHSTWLNVWRIRDDMVHAVTEKLPSLLQYVLMAYQQRSPLMIQRVEGAHAVLWSEAGVRQGEPIGPLLFALKYQPTLHAAQEHAADAIATAHHDDTYLQG